MRTKKGIKDFFIKIPPNEFSYPGYGQEFLFLLNQMLFVKLFRRMSWNLRQSRRRFVKKQGNPEGQLRRQSGGTSLIIQLRILQHGVFP